MHFKGEKESSSDIRNRTISLMVGICQFSQHFSTYFFPLLLQIQDVFHPNFYELSSPDNPYNATFSLDVTYNSFSV